MGEGGNPRLYRFFIIPLLAHPISEVMRVVDSITKSKVKRLNS